MADLADRAAGDRLVEEAWDLWGGLDAWLHLAGADTLTGAAAKLSFDAKLDLLWSVDVVATIRLCREVGRRMTDQGSGSIVTMGWDQAETGMEGDSGELFAAVKGAIMAFTRSLALSLAPTVRVNALAPGWIKTAWGEGASKAWHDRVLRETPLARWGTPEDVAQVARFLVSPAAGFLTGQIVPRQRGLGAIRTGPAGTPAIDSTGPGVNHRPDDRPRYLFVTGRLAEFALRQVLAELAPRAGFAAEVAVLPISVAALMTPKWVARHLSVPDGIDRVILPGYCRGDLGPIVARSRRCPGRAGPGRPARLAALLRPGRCQPSGYGDMTSRSWPRSTMPRGWSQTKSSRRPSNFALKGPT